MKKIILALFIVLPLFIALSLQAEQIDKYDIDIDIQQSGQLHVVENITYNYK